MRENVDIFIDTMACCKSNKTLSDVVQQSISSQKVILEKDKIVLDESRLYKYDKEAEILVSHKRTFEAAKPYADEGKSVCVLNFANAFNPGGGVVLGANAQEESLCRTSTLYPAISDDKMMTEYYHPHRHNCTPLSNGDLIYTPNVTVFKTDTSMPTILPQEQWYDVNVITCAAPDLRSDFISDQELEQLHQKRAKRIIETSISYNNDVLILGAFGCGAFRNNPQIVSLVYKNVVQNYLNAFDTIEFAIYSKTDADPNYSTFKSVFEY